mmetsp:Transcript_9982/g.11474  ORF Transcript_9982/g.11474 Transcript_9982/m.11474 type:complete len:839 (+) Transcript_9982:406-2922(+)
MINAFRGLGEKLIGEGFSTPFVSVGSAYMYPSYVAAVKNLEYVGSKLKNNLDETLSPLVFVFTGSGKVTYGALDVFKAIPSTFCSVQDLGTTIKEATNKGIPIVAAVAEHSDLVRRIADDGFDKQEFYTHPELYKSVFADKVGEYMDVLVNGCYWDSRFPRHVSQKDVRENKFKKLKVVADISCDIKGGVELLRNTTTIESPFLTSNNICIMGVDILPSELPREASEHFGDVLFPYAKSLATGADVDSNSIAPELERACIAANGQLRSKYEYISKLRAENERGVLSRSESGAILYNRNTAIEGTAVFLLSGHLFDSGLINKWLDIVEENYGIFHFAEAVVRPNQKSTVLLQVTMPKGRAHLDAVEQEFRELAAMEEYTDAHASVSKMPESYCSGDYEATLSAFNFGDTEQEGAATTTTAPQILFSSSNIVITILGAGMVAAPAVEYLSRNGDALVRVVSAMEGEANKLCAHNSILGRHNVEAVTCDALTKVDEFAKNSSAIISLLPQTMHIPVAQSCIENSTPLVTASYVSPEMRALDAAAKERGVPILCEMGLDPGMDHMSAMQVIDEMKEAGHRVTSFTSLCGGLPAPEAATNVFGYKFSWSPKGVLTAMSNDALFMENGRLTQVAGKDLLKNAKPFRMYQMPSFALEHLPNRNSVAYGHTYGISDAETIYRGTLRYEGFSKQMDYLRNLGFLRDDISLQHILDQLKGEDMSVEICKFLAIADEQVASAISEMPAIDGFCKYLENKLAYAEGERDMVLMQHTFNDNERVSSLVVYGDGNSSAMAKTVGVTAAVGAELVMGKDSVFPGGILVPTDKSVYIPGLKKLEKEGLRFRHFA